MALIENYRVNEFPILVKSFRRTVLLEHHIFLELGSFEALKDVTHLVSDFLFRGSKFVILPFDLLGFVRSVVHQVFTHWRVNRQKYLEGEKFGIDFVLEHCF